MTDLIFGLGVGTKNSILGIAAALGGEAIPGTIVLLLLVSLIAFVSWACLDFRKKIKAVRDLQGEVKKGADKLFVEVREDLKEWARGSVKGPAARAVADAWREFDETLVQDDSTGQYIVHNSVRPSAFFNLDDLHFSNGFLKVVPGLFVSVGLALTFLGLIAALSSMGNGAINDATMANLLKIASAKFIMSLTGLACSIVFTIVLRILTGRLEHEIHQLCQKLEERLIFLSLEYLGYEQLRTMKDAREHSRQLTTEIIAELGRPLREELPAAISMSISTAMEPLLAQISRQGTDSMSDIANGLSQQLTSSIGSALSAASDKLAQAGDRIGALSDRMDQSSGRIGSEMEQAVARVAQAVEELRSAIASSAESTAGVFAHGAEQMMASMNRTLEGIRDNTATGAKAMSAAADEMRQAAAGMRMEMESAARSTAAATQQRIEEAGAQASSAVDTAGRSVIDAFGKAGVEIAQLAGQLSTKAGKDLLQPISDIASQLDAVAGVIGQGAADVRRASDAVRDGATAGAEAAVSFRAAAHELINAASPVRATSERIEGSLRQLSDAMRDGLSAVQKSAEHNAANASQILDTARASLSAEREGIEKSLSAVGEVLGRIRGQGDRLDTIDQKLGKAFDLYTEETERAMQAIRNHAQEMAGQLNLAVSQLDNAIQQMQEFTPEQVGR